MTSFSPVFADFDCGRLNYKNRWSEENHPRSKKFPLVAAALRFAQRRLRSALQEYNGMIVGGWAGVI